MKIKVDAVDEKQQIKIYRKVIKTVVVFFLATMSMMMLTNSANQSFAADGSLSIESINPNKGLVAGGTQVTITGTGFVLPPAFTDVSVGEAHACAVSEEGAVYCWGANSYGQLGDNSTTDSLVPVAVDMSGVLSGKRVASVSVGVAHSCAVAYDEGDVTAIDRVYCWGFNAMGQLGNNSTTNSLAPVAVNTAGALAGKHVYGLSAGSFFNCVVAGGDANVNVYCWGYNEFGQLGDNSTTNSSVPVAVEMSGALSGEELYGVSAGSGHVCGITNNDTTDMAEVYCWGNNDSGQLGNNSTTNSSVPVAVSTAGVLAGKDVYGVGVGYAHSCAVAYNGATDMSEAYCWGNNDSGQLGNGSTDDSLVPVAVDTAGVLAGKDVYKLSAGSYFTCGRGGTEDELYCWGGNGSGQLGNGSTDDSLVPVAVDTAGVLSGNIVYRFSAGDKSICAIADENKAYCWGENGSGQLGNNSTTDSLVPVAVEMTDIVPAVPTVSLPSSGYGFCGDVQVVSDAELTCVMPAHDAGKVSVWVYSLGGYDVLEDGFEFVESLGVPNTGVFGDDGSFAAVIFMGVGFGTTTVIAAGVLFVKRWSLRTVKFRG